MLKKIFSLLFFIYMNVVLLAQQHNIIGVWEGVDEKNEGGKIEFKKDGSAVLFIKGNALQISKYKIDYKKDPIWVDLIMKTPQNEITLPCLLKFINENKIMWEVFPDGKRGIKFSDKTLNTAIILNRKRKSNK